MNKIATLTSEFGECSTCGSNATPAWMFPALDKTTGKQKRVCGVCHASMSADVGFVTAGRYEELRAQLIETSALLKTATEALDGERQQVLNVTAKLERAEAELDSVKSQLSSTASAHKIERRRADEAERGIVGVEAYRRLFAEAQEAKAKTTTKQREKVAA